MLKKQETFNELTHTTQSARDSIDNIDEQEIKEQLCDSQMSRMSHKLNRLSGSALSSFHSPLAPSFNSFYKKSEVISPQKFLQNDKSQLIQD